MTPTLNPIRLVRRWRCHRSLWCCQYVDRAMCNSWADPHWLARRRYRHRRGTTTRVAAGTHDKAARHPRRE